MPFSLTTKGILACLGAALLWGANGVASKYLMNGGLSPFVWSQGRLTIAAIITILWLLVTDPKSLRVAPRHLLHFVLLGSLGMAGVNGCYFAAISRIPTAAAILIEYLAPALIALFAWAFMQQHLGRLKLIALGLALAGCYFVVGGYNLHLFQMNLAGMFWGLGAAFTYSFYIVYSEFSLRNYSPWTLTCYALIVAGITWNIVLGPSRMFHMGWDIPSWTTIFLAATVGTVLPFGLFAYGIERLRSTRATIIATFEPIAAGLIAFLFLGERLRGLQIVGGLAVLSAVVMIQWEKEHDPRAPAMIKAMGKA
jgi:drug/metabolite transporter (DMT)-like permease